MPAIKFQMNVRADADSNMSLSIEGFADTEEEAEQIGSDHKKLIDSYLEGYNKE